MTVMKTFLIKNNSGSDQTISDLGVTIADAGTLQADDQYTHWRIYSSNDLRALVSAGTLVINDGTSDLSTANGVNYLFSASRYESLQDHYTKTELQNGTVDVHWNVLTNVPPLGWSGIHEPVKYVVTDIGLASPPGSPDDLDVYIDDNDHYWSYNGATWDDLGAASNGDRVIDLSNAQEDITEYVTDTWVAEAQALDNSIVSVDKVANATKTTYVEAQYVYDTTTASWKLWARTDFSGHLNGGANKHDATEIDVETSRSNLGITAPTDLESAFGDIDTAVGNAQSAADAAQADIDAHTDGTANKHDASEIDIETSRTTLGITAPTDLDSALGNINTALGAWSLDKAYDTAAGSGAGRIITVDSGSMELDRASGTDSPFRIVPKAALPTTNLADGQIDVRDGIVWVYDGTRGLWLSTFRHTEIFAETGKVKDRWLFVGGVVSSQISGPRFEANGVITSVSAQFSGSGTANVRVRLNGSVTNTVTLTVTAAAGGEAINVNANVSQGDFLGIYVESAAGVDDPIVKVEWARRG